MHLEQDCRPLRIHRTTVAIVMAACSAGFATSAVSAATVSAVATGTLASATLNGTSINGSLFTWTIEFDDSAFTNIGGTNYWNSISKSEMVINSVGTVNNLAIGLISPLGNTFRTYQGSAGFAHFNFSNTPISGMNWTNATTNNFGAWDADITGSSGFTRTFTTNLGTLVISNLNYSSFISGVSAVPGGGIAAIATLGLAGIARRRR